MMKATPTIPIFFVPLLVVACAPTSRPGAVLRVARRGGAVTREFMPPTAKDREIGRAIDAMTRATEAGRPEAAEAVADAHLGDPEYGNLPSLTKARILARRGERDAALDLYLGTLRNPKLAWSPDSRDLAPAFELAVGLGRDAEADELATRMIARPCTIFFNETVQAPHTADTARERRAYAYLDIANDLWESHDHERFVRYARKAQAILPDAVPVRAHLAFALTQRGKPGDEAEAASLLRAARAQTGGTARRQVEEVALASRLNLDSPTGTGMKILIRK